MAVFNTDGFESQYTSSDVVLGLPVPAVGTPVRRYHPVCAVCARKGEHLGNLGYDVEGCTSYERESHACKLHDDYAERLMQAQAVNHLLGTHGSRVFRETGGHTWKEAEFPINTFGTTVIECRGTADNDPANQHGFCLHGWGFAEIRGSKITGFGLQVVVTDISEADVEGNRTITFLPITYLPGVGLLDQRANPAVPVSLVFRYHDPPLIYSALRKLETMACSWHEETLAAGGLTAGVNTIWSDGRRIAWPGRVVWKLVSGVETQIYAIFRNVSVGGTNNVQLDLTGTDLGEAGLTGIKIGCWLEGAATGAAGEVVYENTDSPAATTYTIASDKKLAEGAAITLECRTNGTDWHDGSDGGTWEAGTVASVWNAGIGWYDVKWIRDGLLMMFQPAPDPPPDPLPDPWEPPPAPDPIAIDGIRATVQVTANPGGDFHLFADRCQHDTPSKSVGLTDAVHGCKRFCSEWKDLSSGEKAEYHVGCMNEACASFGPGTLERADTYSNVPVRGLVDTYPYTAKYQAGNPNDPIWAVRGAHGLKSNSGTLIDAPAGPQHDKTENCNGIGGWGKVGTSSYTYEQEETHWEYPEEGEPYEVTETVTYTVDNVALLTGIDQVAVKVPLLAGRGSVHRDEGVWRGSGTGKRRTRRVVLVLPAVVDTLEPQEYPDGTITRVAGTLGAFAYQAVLEIKNHVRCLKTLERYNLRVVRTVRLAGTSNPMPILHAATTYSKQYTTGDDEEPVSVKTGGTSVLHPTNRPTNVLCPESLVGDGDDESYIYAGDGFNGGMGLRIPEGAPAPFAGMIFQITAAVSCDAETGSIEPGFAAEAAKLEGVQGVPQDFETVYQYRDTVSIADELGQWAAWCAAVNPLDYEYEIVDQPRCGEYCAISYAKPDGSNQAVSVAALPSSGRYYLSVDPLGWCVVAELDQAESPLLLSASQDLAPIQATQANMLATIFTFGPVIGMPGDNREWHLNIEYERWRYSGGVIIGDGYENKFAIETPPPPPLENTSGEVRVGVFDVEYDEVHAYRFAAVVSLGGIPGRSGELDSLFAGSAGIPYAGTNTSIVVTSSGILRTISLEDGNQIEHDEPLNEGLSVKLALYGVNYPGPTYTNLATLEASSVSGDGRYRTYPSTKIVKAYCENKTSYQAFIVIPVVGDWAIPPGAAVGYEFLYQLIQQGLDRQLHLEDNVVVGTIKLRQFSCHIVSAAGGVVQLSSAGFSLAPAARVSYGYVPAGIKLA